MKAALANAAWLASNVPAWLRFRRGLRRPEETQRGILRRLLAANAASAFGRAHGFREIRSYEQYRARLPIADHNALEPWIDRIMRGESSILTCEPVTRLLPTSGSSRGRKLIPWTAGFQRELNAAIGPWMFDLGRRHPGIVGGPAYWSISPALPKPHVPSAVPVGFDDDSAYLGGWQRRLVEAAFAVPSALRLVCDLPTARYLTLLCLLRHRELRLISVWHPTFLTLLLDALPACWDELLRDLEDGGCTRDLPPLVQRAMEQPPQPGRAHELHRLSPANPQAMWPHLQIVSCWGDGQAKHARADLQRRLPSVIIQSKGLLATEAFVSIPYARIHPIAVASHFYEFIDAGGTARLAHELRLGERYEVVVTTASGLWRYRLGDFVEVDGLVAATPSLRFLGRGNSVSDLCGEKLAEIFVTKAIASACAACDFSPSFAMLAPENAASAGCYTLFVEGAPPDGLLASLEEELRANPHYALCRDLGQLSPLQCLPVRGAHERFCAASGLRLGDIKPRALSSSLDWRARFASCGAEPK